MRLELGIALGFFFWGWEVFLGRECGLILVGFGKNGVSL